MRWPLIQLLSGARRAAINNLQETLTSLDNDEARLAFEQIFEGGVRVTSLDGVWGNGWTLELRQRPWAEVIPRASRRVLPKVGCGGRI